MKRKDGGPLSSREQRPGQAEPLYLALEARDFPAQALAAWDPSLRDRAFVVVDQDPESHKTHVIACSRAAQDLGIRAGLPYAAVRRRWRQVPALFRRHDWEAALREELRALCHRYTPEYEIREEGSALLDLAGTPALRQAAAEASRAGYPGRASPGGGAPGPAPRTGVLRPFPRAARGAARGAAQDMLLQETPGPEEAPDAPALRLARRLQAEVLFHTGLSEAAVGVASTRLMARVMARQALPGGIAACPPGREADTLAPLPPSALPGLSPQCRERIRRYALASVGQIRGLGREAVAARFGNEGDKLYTLACGLDLAPVAPKGRGILAETVLEEDLNDDDALLRKVRLTADKLAFRLKKEGVLAGKLIVAIRYSDHKAARKTVKVSPPTDDYKTLADLAARAFGEIYGRRVALRAVALAVARPEAEKGQVDLFEGEGDRRQRAIGEALTRIRKRSGFAVIGSAGSGGEAEEA